MRKITQNVFVLSLTPEGTPVNFTIEGKDEEKGWITLKLNFTDIS